MKSSEESEERSMQIEVNVAVAGVILALGSSAACAQEAATRVYPGIVWSYASTPEERGWSSARLGEAWALARNLGSGGLFTAAWWWRRSAT
jgi:hypothetical protein